MSSSFRRLASRSLCWSGSGAAGARWSIQRAENGYTSLIHGKVSHEETRATASQAVEHGGHYLVVLDDREAVAVCQYIRTGIDSEAFRAHCDRAGSAGFDPARDLQRIGLANQTTMLMSESLAVEAMLKQAMVDRYGEVDLDVHFQAFDTICSATQDRQDAVVALLRDKPVDLILVIGGYNSSNTCNLARICASARPTFHVADPTCLVSALEIRHRPVGTKTEVTTTGWLPAGGAVAVGLTSGASTPDNLVAAAVDKLAAFCA
jgi:4-hydroxy-3-methylbut-2-enyl diphosphate reductase